MANGLSPFDAETRRSIWLHRNYRKGCGVIIVVLLVVLSALVWWISRLAGCS